MVYAFALPTTSHLSFQTFLTSSTHPSLPQSASTARHALRLALKAHKRLPRGPQQDTHLPAILAALNDYLPYLFAISHGLSGKPTEHAGEEIEITLHAEVEAEWRATLTSSTSLSSLKGIAGAASTQLKNGRIRGRGIDFEIAFTLTTLGYVLSGLARSGLLSTFYAIRTPTAEQRTTAVQTATRYMLQASAVHSRLASSPSFAGVAVASSGRTNVAIPDLDPATQSALSSLALAEATLLAVLKDDVYLATCIQARNPHDKDWMVGTSDVPKVRALLFARLCVRAAEYAEQAAAGLGSVGAEGRNGSVDDDLVKYAGVLGRVSRAKACRFFGIDSELADKIGDGIAWLRAAKGVLALRSSTLGEEGEAYATKNKGLGGFSRWKKEWTERREERKMEKDAGGKGDTYKGELDPGDNAGREEEGRVIEMLETKWVKMNDTINTQRIPQSTNLLSSLPSGRDIHTPPAPYKPPSLDEEQLIHMRAPPEDDEPLPGSDGEDSDEERTRVGSYGGTFAGEGSGSAYY
ncbi:hypothetical protein MPDQ_000913 [Monascus purpureus]|uniref:pH-response regulator protein palC n=2 Tax=Monascus TaxID=5097 RepID=A0A507QSD2_MONPU|nr:pH-response regulator protein PalC [Monascus ruber]TQB70135.1 hypothetical protein MPDQ_000913 [Monascus purpureus]BDD62570.1 hypothetical protein MAP00_007538 [Monascus purpureus]